MVSKSQDLAAFPIQKHMCISALGHYLKYCFYLLVWIVYFLLLLFIKASEYSFHLSKLSENIFFFLFFKFINKGAYSCSIGIINLLGEEKSHLAVFRHTTGCVSGITPGMAQRPTQRSSGIEPKSVECKGRALSALTLFLFISRSSQGMIYFSVQIIINPFCYFMSDYREIISMIALIIFDQLLLMWYL